MRLLLDSHIVLAILDEKPGALPQEAHRGFRDSDATLVMSVASLWEIAIKSRLGKLKLSVPLSALPGVVEDLNIGLLSINQRHVLADLDPEPPTRDPFDRLLLAQCAVEGMRLVTRDRALVDHPLVYRGG